MPRRMTVGEDIRETIGALGSGPNWLYPDFGRMNLGGALNYGGPWMEPIGIATDNSPGAPAALPGYAGPMARTSGQAKGPGNAAALTDIGAALGGLRNYYMDYFGLPFSQNVRALHNYVTQPRREDQAGAPAPTAAGPHSVATPAATEGTATSGPHAPEGASAPLNLWAELLKPSGSAPTALQLPKAPELKRPKDVEYPTTAVPQMTRPVDFNPKQARDLYNNAKPEDYKADQKEMLIAGLLGSLGGIASAQSGDRLGNILGRMVASGAGPALQARAHERALERQSKAEQRQHSMAGANMELGIESQRVARADRQDDVAYRNETATREDMLRRSTYNMDLLKIENSLAQGDYANALERARLLREAGVQDKQLDLMERRINAALGAAAIRSGGGGANVIRPLNAQGSEFLLSAVASRYVPAVEAELLKSPDMKQLRLLNPVEFNRMVQGHAHGRMLSDMAATGQLPNFLGNFRQHPAVDPTLMMGLMGSGLIP